MQDPDLLAHLLPLLTDADPNVRYEVVKAVGTLSSPRVVPHLAPLLSLPDAQWRLRCAAVKAVAAVRDPQILPLLTPLLTDPQGYIRLLVVQALGEVHIPQTRLLLEQVRTDDDDPRVRAAAAKALVLATRSG